MAVGRARNRGRPAERCAEQTWLIRHSSGCCLSNREQDDLISTEECDGYCVDKIFVTSLLQDRNISLKGKLGFRLPLLAVLVQEFPVSHDEAPRRDKSPGDHVLEVHALLGI